MYRSGPLGKNIPLSKLKINKLAVENRSGLPTEEARLYDSENEVRSMLCMPDNDDR